MALFARMHPAKAQQLLDTAWPRHVWTKKTLWFLLTQAVNSKHIQKIPLNDHLLQSVKQHGYVSPFLTIDTWYPICGGQRLRVAMELPEKYLKNTYVDVCRIVDPVWQPFHHWHSKEEGQKACQIMFQMYEVVFKTLYMEKQDPSGIDLLHFEEYGNQLHWPTRDGAPPVTPAAAGPKSAGPPSKKKMVIPRVSINNT